MNRLSVWSRLRWRRLLLFPSRMRLWSLACLPLALVAADPVCPVPGYRFVWGDEFAGTKLDTDKWVYRTGPRLWSEQRAANVSLVDGRLRLTGLKEDAGDLKYTAGGVISKRLFRYAYYEASFKVPPGAGWHTSFWVLRNGGKGDEPRVEIDICENDSVRLTDYGINHHQWTPLPHVALGGKHIKTPDLSAAFHVWGCEFTSTELRHYFDGKLVHRFDATKLRHGDGNVWLTTIAAGLGGTKSVDEKRLPAYAEFDYVRVFTPVAPAPVETGPTTETPGK